MGFDDLLERWEAAGLITPSQAAAIRSYEERRAPAAATPSGAPPPPPLPTAPPAAPPAPPTPRAAPEPRAAAAAAFEPERPRAADSLPSLGLGTDFGGIDLRTLGTVLAGLALLALLGNIFAVSTDLLIGPGSKVAQTVEDVLHLIASVCGLVGGLRLAGGRESGRSLVYWSLGINVVSTIVLGAAHLAQAFTILTILCWLVLLFLTWRARYRSRYRFF